MANNSQNWILHSLNLLTPRLIEELTSSAFHRKASLPLAAGAELQSTVFEDDQRNPQKPSNQNSAKIIPFKKEHSEFNKNEIEEELELNTEEAKIELNHEELNLLNSNSALESLGIVNSEKQKIIDQIQIKKQKQKEDSSTLFLLKQRHKLKNCQEMLQTQDAIKSYKKSSTEDTKTKYDETGKPIVGSSGILVNKKHF